MAALTPTHWGKVGRVDQLDILQPLLLENEWAFWFDRYIGPGKSVEEYADAMKKLGKVHSVQDFWRWFNNLPAPRELPPRSSYHLMKEGVRPMWEDPHNALGGCFSFRVTKRDSSYAWQQVVLGVIGEQFSSFVMHEKDEVCGLTLSVRQDCDLISLWNRSSSLSAHAMSLMPALLHTLLPELRVTVSYKVHFSEADFKPKEKQLPLPALPSGAAPITSSG